MVPVESRFRVVKDDPKDDVILGTAYDGEAEYIVSGDRHLLKMGRFKGIRIVNPKQMMKILARKFPQLVLNL
jgi:predicted nucleic acid-binding protein